MIGVAVKRVNAAKLVESWKLTKMGSKIRNLHRGHREHREGSRKDEELPDRVNEFGATDFTVRGNQRKAFDKRGGPDNAICRVFGISSRKSHGAGTCTAIGGQDDKAGFDFLEDGFEA
jgi:hypothetical protein